MHVCLHQFPWVYLSFFRKTMHLRIAVYRNMRALIQSLYFEATGVTLLPNSITSRHIKCHGELDFSYIRWLYLDQRKICAFEFVVGKYLNLLTHWGRDKHMCVRELGSDNGSDKGVSPVLCQAIICTNADLFQLVPSINFEYKNNNFRSRKSN